MRQVLGLFQGKAPLEDAVPEPTPAHFDPVSVSGTDLYGGIFDEDYLHKLQGREAADIYDAMRRGDSQIAALMSLCKNPIRGANWYVQPVDDSDEEQEIRDFVSFLLFEDIQYPDGTKYKTWPDFLTEALSMLDFGHSIFEVVHKSVQGHSRWGDYIGLSDLAWRSPKSIEFWRVANNGALTGIVQQVQGDIAPDENNQIAIEGKFLLPLVVNKEGDNYEGISMLRAIYGNYIRKQVYEKMQAIGNERNALGIPVIRIPDDKTADSKVRSQAAAIATALTGHQSSGITLPAGFEIEDYKLSHDPDKLQRTIDAENRQMYERFLAQFLKLGQGGSGGAYSIGVDQSDMFLSTLVQVADIIADAVNRRIVEPLVRARFGERDTYPVLSVKGINDKGTKELAETLVMLTGAGLLQPNRRIQEQLHETYDLPDVQDGEGIDDVSDDELAPETEDTNVQDEVATTDVAERDEASLQRPFLLTSEQRNAVRLAAPTLGQINRNAKDFQDMSEAALTAAAASYIDRVIRAVDNNTPAARRRAAMQVDLTGKAAYQRDVVNFLDTLAVDSQNQVLQEMRDQGVEGLPDNTDDLLARTRQRVRTEGELVVDDQYEKMGANFRFYLNSSLDKENPDQLRQQLTRIAGEFVTGATVRVGSVNYVSGTINETRNDVFQTPEVFNQIETFIFQNPAPVAAICKNLAGRVFTKEEYATTTNLPPLHPNCKSIIVAQAVTKRNPRPLSPEGLQVTGTQTEVRDAIKSKKF